MSTEPTVYDQMQNVEEGDLVRWRGRTHPQVVTEVNDTWFEVQTHNQKYLRFYPHGQYLENQQSGNEYQIHDGEFEIVGEAYSIDRWLDS